MGSYAKASKIGWCRIGAGSSFRFVRCMKEIKKGGLRRRFAVGVAGARGGVGLLSSKATGFLLPKEQKRLHNEMALEREAMRFVVELGKLKGAYVKIGQMLALYGEHVLPKAVTKALHTLEAQTEPLSWGAIKKQLEPNNERLTIKETPLAAASLAQVHLASSIQIDKPLCLKIQYPGVADSIEDDFRNVLQMLTLARWAPSGRQFQDLVSELKAHLVSEVDYVRELQTAEEVSRLLAGDDRYLVPGYYREYCSTSVLAMDYINGFEVTHPKVQALSQTRRNKLADAMLNLFFKEAFEWRLMQTDPNFGNYRVLIDPQGEDDKLVLLDFGAVQSLPTGFSRALKETILAAHYGDEAKTVSGLIELNCLRSSDSDKVKQSFIEFCELIIEPFARDFSDVPNYAVTEGGAYDWHASRLLKRAGKLGSKRMLAKGFVVPPSEFMLMVRKLTGVFTFVSTLKAQTKSCHLLERYTD